MRRFAGGFLELEERRFCHALTYLPRTNTFKQKISAEQVAELLRTLDDPASAPFAKTLPYELNGYQPDG